MRHRYDDRPLFTAAALCLLAAAIIEVYRGGYGHAIALLVVALPCAMLGKP